MQPRLSLFRRPAVVGAVHHTQIISLGLYCQQNLPAKETIDIRTTKRFRGSRGDIEEASLRVAAGKDHGSSMTIHCRAGHSTPDIAIEDQKNLQSKVRFSSGIGQCAADPPGAWEFTSRCLSNAVEYVGVKACVWGRRYLFRI
jgi:hypothetical protein